VFQTCQKIYVIKFKSLFNQNYIKLHKQGRWIRIWYNFFMIINFLIKACAGFVYSGVKNREKQLGYKIVFPKLSPHWIDGTVLYDMTSIWKKAGLNAIGVNYFTIGELKNEISTRFDPESSYYQAWLGGYLVKFTNPYEWSLEDHYKLAIADQKNWLKVFGDKKPFVEIDYKSAKAIEKITIAGYKGKLYEGGIWSDTDMGNGNNNFFLTVGMKAMSYWFEKNNPRLSLFDQQLFPKWNKNQLLDSYQKIYLFGYCAIVEVTNTVKAILYINGAKYTDKNGKNYDSFSLLYKEFKKLIKEIEIQSI